MPAFDRSSHSSSGAFYSSTLDFGNGNILTRWGTLVKTDAWTAKFDAATGNSVWAVDIGGPDNDDFGFDIAVEPSTGDSISTGNFIAATLHVGPSYSVNKTGPVGYNNAFVVRLSSTGSVEFVEQVGLIALIVRLSPLPKCLTLSCIVKWNFAHLHLSLFHPITHAESSSAAPEQLLLALPPTPSTSTRRGATS